MTDKGGKTLALTATLAAAVVVLARDAKARNGFDPRKLIGVAVWGGSATILAGFAPGWGAIMAVLLLADVLVVPAGSASLIDSLLGSGSAPRAAPGPAQPNRPI